MTLTQLSFMSWEQDRLPHRHCPRPEGHRVVVFDPLSAQKLQSRSRAYAITHSSRRLLSRLELWTDLEASLAGFSALDLRDSGCSATCTSTGEIWPHPTWSRARSAGSWTIGH